MVSKEGGKCMLTNSESDSETTTTAAPSPSPCSASLALEAKCSLDASRQVRKRNKALQVRFKDICEAQNEQREAALLKGGKGAVAYKVAYRKYMTVPARRSIPNVTRSTGVQTSPDLKKRYQTFPFERKKGHTFKHVASVESYKGQNNGFVVDVKPPSSSNKAAARLGLDEEEGEGDLGAGGGACGGSVRRTRALLHTNECVGTVEQHSASGGLCGAADGALQLSCSGTDASTDCLPRDAAVAVGMEADYQLCSVPPKPRTGLQQHQQHQHREGSGERSAKRQLAANPGDSSYSTRTLPDRASRQVTGPIAWNSLTQVECLDSPSVRSKRKKGQQLLQLNGLQSSSSQTLPRAAGCTTSTQAQCHAGQLSARPLRAMEAEPLGAAPSSSCGGGGRGEASRRGPVGGATAAADHPGLTGEACKQIVPVSQEGGGDVKAQLQAMENLISSSQETIKVLLGVIQELEKGEAHREGLSYRTGQDTANCDTCRNSACIIYSVELDFKQQEDKLQPLMKRLCPTDDAYFSPLPYPSSGEAFTSTPKRKSKAESKKHARWKLWFL